MNAIFSAHRLASNLCLARETPTASLESLTDPTGTFGKSAVFGFPYLDTLKLLEHGSLSGGAIFYAKGDGEELQQLDERLQAGRCTDDGSLEPLQAIFCEHPTNPLLNLLTAHVLQEHSRLWLLALITWAVTPLLVGRALYVLLPPSCHSQPKAGAAADERAHVAYTAVRVRDE